MTRILFFCISALTVALLYSPVTQAKVLLPGCGNENAQITVTFNESQPDVGGIKAKFDAKVKEISQAAKEAGAEKFYIQSSNYNVSQQNYSGPEKEYRLNGTVTYHVEPSDKALTIMETLTKKGYVASVNVNSYNGGGINCNAVTPPAVD